LIWRTSSRLLASYSPLPIDKLSKHTYDVARRHFGGGYPIGGLHYAAYEARVETKASDESWAGIGGRGRFVSITNGGRIRSDRWAGSGYADDAEQRGGSRNHSR